MDQTLAPTRDAALLRLGEFVPYMGRSYATGRNCDPGPLGERTVSRLSPYIRHRLLLEEEIVQAAEEAHGLEARAFVEQVLWRTYWRGWLEHRPAVWLSYRRGLDHARDRLAVEEGLRRVFHDATEGDTGIACFDAWARELVATNRLHNHARMWFASIWIFTLRLPWQLGAAFFLRHLLDGDPASNTLSWRWVAGLHTRGKCYVARADNIARYTLGRFSPAGQLDEAPEPLTEDETFPPRSLPAADALPSGDVAVLLHSEDCLPETLGWAGGWTGRVAAVACVAAGGSETAGRVAAFRQGAMSDAARRLGHLTDDLDAGALADWIGEQRCPVVTAGPPVGPVADVLADLPVHRIRREWDETAWPNATGGFFRFRDRVAARRPSIRSNRSYVAFPHDMSAKSR